MQRLEVRGAVQLYIGR